MALGIVGARSADQFQLPPQAPPVLLALYRCELEAMPDLMTLGIVGARGAPMWDLPPQDFPPMRALSYAGPLRAPPMPNLMSLGIAGLKRQR